MMNKALVLGGAQIQAIAAVHLQGHLRVMASEIHLGGVA